MTTPLFGEIKTKLKEKVILSKEVGNLMIYSDKAISRLMVPKVFGITWLRQQTQYIALEDRFVYNISFSVDDLGKIRVPAFSAIMDDETKENIAGFTIEVIRSRKPSNNLKDNIFVKAFVEGKEQKNFSTYPGIEVDMEFRIYISNDYRNSKNINPSFELNGLSHNNQSSKIEESTLIENNHRYKIISFKTKMIPFQTGKVSGKVKFELGVASNKSNSFFSHFTNYKKISVESSFQMNVNQLPPLKKTAFFLNLIGKWAVKTKVNKSSVEVGELFEYIFEIRGKGDIARLNKKLETLFEGFELFPIEEQVQKKGEEKIIYLKIPMVAKSVDNKLKIKQVAIFNSEKLKYDYFNLFNAIRIKSTETLPELEDDKISKRETPIVKEKKKTQKSRQKDSRKSFVFTKDLLIYLAGGIVSLFIIYMLLFKFTLPKHIRRKIEIGRAKRDLLRSFRKVKDTAGLYLFVREKLVEYLIFANTLDNGLDASQVASFCKDEKVKEILLASQDTFSGKQKKLDKQKLEKIIKGL